MRVAPLTRVILLTLGLPPWAVALAEEPKAPTPNVVVQPTVSTYHIPPQIVIVHWKIKPGREAEFLDYWSTRSVIGDRSGLVGEYLSSVANRDRAPWINWQNLSLKYTSYFNVGVWRDVDAFQEQIGQFIDNDRPSLPFEAERRERVLLNPETWRIGRSTPPTTDAPGVK